MINRPDTFALPEDLALYIRSIDQCEEQLASLVDALSEAQAFCRPDRGRSWSVIQCVDHISMTNSHYLNALKLAAVRANLGHRPLQAGGWISDYFLQKTEPPVSLRVKAPAKITPRSTISRSDVLSKLVESNEDIRDFVRATSHLDLCSVRFRNPFVPILRFTAATGLLIMAAHTRRHLWQAERIVPQIFCD